MTFMTLGRFELIVSGILIFGMVGYLFMLGQQPSEEKNERISSITVEIDNVTTTKVLENKSIQKIPIIDGIPHLFDFPDLKLNNSDFEGMFDNPLVYPAFESVQRIQLLIGNSRYAIQLSQSHFGKMEKSLARNPEVTIIGSHVDFYEFINAAKGDDRREIVKSYKLLQIFPPFARMHIQMGLEGNPQGPLVK